MTLSTGLRDVYVMLAPCSIHQGLGRKSTLSTHMGLLALIPSGFWIM